MFIENQAREVWQRQPFAVLAHMQSGKCDFPGQLAGAFRGGRIGGNTAPGLWLLGVNRRLMEGRKKGVSHVDMAARNACQRNPESLAGLSVPVLLIAGSGHALMAERPDAVLDALREFIVG